MVKRAESQVHDSIGLFKLLGEAVSAREEPPLYGLAGRLALLALRALHRLTQLGASAPGQTRAPPPPHPWADKDT